MYYLINNHITKNESLGFVFCFLWGLDGGHIKIQCINGRALSIMLVLLFSALAKSSYMQLFTYLNYTQKNQLHVYQLL